MEGSWRGAAASAGEAEEGEDSIATSRRVKPSRRRASINKCKSVLSRVYSRAFSTTESDEESGGLEGAEQGAGVEGMEGAEPEADGGTPINLRRDGQEISRNSDATIGSHDDNCLEMSVLDFGRRGADH